MITNLKDEEGKIIAYCEWRLVGPSGLEVPSGRYIWVCDMWVHDSVRFKKKVEMIIDEILRLVPTAEQCYFQRKNVNDKLHMYSRSQWERRRMSHDPTIRDKEI